MRISLLLEREPFGEILERTLERFLPHLTGRAHAVTWYPRNPGIEALRRRGQQPWLCNTYLNAIFAPDADPETLAPALREFTRSTRWWRRPVQRAYVRLASLPLTSSRLAQAAVGIAPPLPEPEARLIVGGNHKIRLLDHRRRRAYGLLKDGFANGFMLHELRARRTAEAVGVPVPHLEEVSDDGAWFCESYVSGTPVNRLSNVQIAGRTVRDAWQALQRLYEATRAEVSVGSYTADLRQAIESHLALGPAPDLNDEIRSGMKTALALLAPHRDEHLLTALAHGDFQPANILWDGERVWLIDWEYAAVRQAGYDALVYGLAARAPTGMAGRLARFLAAGELPIRHSLPPEWRRPECRHRAAMLFILEELELRLRELTGSGIAHMKGALPTLVNEARRLFARVEATA